MGIRLPEKYALRGVSCIAMVLRMSNELTETQLSQVLGGLSAVEPRTVRKYLKGNKVQPFVAERIELARGRWAEMVSLYDAACAQKKGASHGA